MACPVPNPPQPLATPLQQEEECCRLRSHISKYRTIGKKGKVLPHSLPSVGPGADPGVQAVSPQVTLTHSPGSRLPLLPARPVVTSVSCTRWRQHAVAHIRYSSSLIIYRPIKDERLSWPGSLTCSGLFTHKFHNSCNLSAASRAWDRESSPARDRRSTTVPRSQRCMYIGRRASVKFGELLRKIVSRTREQGRRRIGLTIAMHRCQS